MAETTEAGRLERLRENHADLERIKVGSLEGDGALVEVTGTLLDLTGELIEWVSDLQDQVDELEDVKARLDDAALDD